MKITGPYETETQEFKTSLSELDKGIISLTGLLQNLLFCGSPIPVFISNFSSIIFHS